MAVLALAVAGSALGASVLGTGVVALGMTGGAIGWAAGSVLGGLLFPPKMPDGPRLDDLSVQVSTYGTPIPRGWGRFRVAGNVIWASNLVEHAEEQGGKGGSSYSTYSYSCSFAVALLDTTDIGEIAGVLRIWADGRLIYDARPDNTGKTKDFEAVSFVVYPGSETQEPDPTMQALEGDVPAYRGLAYVVFDDMMLERYGNRIPNLSFEVVTAGTLALEAPTQFGERYSWGSSYTFESDMTTDGKFWVGTTSGHAVYDGGTDTWSLDPDAADGTLQVQRYSTETLELEFAVNISQHAMRGSGAGYGTSFYMGRGQPGLARDGFIDCPDSSAYCYSLPNAYSHGIAVADDGLVINYVDSASSSQFQNAFYWPGTPYFTPDDDGIVGDPTAAASMPRVSWWSQNGIISNGGVRFLLSGGQDRDADNVCECGPIPPDFDGVWTSGGGSWSFKSTTTSDGYSVIQGWYGPSASWLFDGRTEVGYSLPGSGVRMPSIVIDEARDCVWAWAGEDAIELYRDGVATGFTLTEEALGYFEWRVLGSCIDQETGNLRLLCGEGAVTSVVLFNPDTETIIDRVTVGTGITNIAKPGRLFDFPDRGAVLYSDGYANWWIPYQPRLASECVPLSEIVTDLSIASGLTADDIDVAELTDCVLGYTISRQGTARSAIEQLMVAYGFDAVQSGLKIKYVKRGKAPVVTIALDDLAAHDSGGDTPEPLALTRGDDVALPATVTVKYVDEAADYQTGVQIAARQTGRARGEMAVDLPVVLTGAHAKAVADQALYSGWVARTKTSFATSMAYLRIEPTDVVTIEGRNLYITRRTVNGGVIEYEAEQDPGMAMIGGAVAGAGTGRPVQAINTVPASFLLLLDAPLMRDADDALGTYYAVYGATGGGTWRGANVEVSLTGASWSAVATVAAPGSTVGTATTELADWTGGWVFDEISRVTVTMQNGTLESKLRAEVLAGQNRALIGADGRWEVIHYRNATLNVDGTYTLSGLLRGRYGTEWAMGTHAVGDRLITMPATALLTREIDNADLGVTYQYHAVTLGGTRAAAVSSGFSIDGERLKPLAPVDLRRSRAAGDVVLAWKRRTRLSTRFTGGAGINVPLGETSEAYSVDVFDDNTYTTVVRTIGSLVTPTATYTAAQQTTDFGSPQATVYVRVYQVSAEVGRGHYLEGTA